MEKSTWRNFLILLLTACIWGVAFVAQSVSMDYIGPFTFTCVRNLIGFAVLVPSIRILDRIREKSEKNSRNMSAPVRSAERNPDGLPSDSPENGKADSPEAGKADGPENGKADSPETGKENRRTLICGGICCGVALCVAGNLQQIGIQYTTVGKAGFITAMYIVLVPVLGIFLKRAAGLKVWGSVALAVTGLYLLCMTEGITIQKGDLLVMLCALAFACHILIIDHFSSRTDGVRMACIQFLVCGILSGIGACTEHPDLASLLAAWMPILYAGVLSSGVAYTLQIIGQKGMNPTVASLIMSLESVVSVLAGWLLLGQKMTARELGGCVLMFAAILLAQLPSRRRGE